MDAPPPPPGSILAPDGPVARRLERYEERPEQQAMLAAVEQALARGAHLLVEAGTGVGKSFGYLVPALHHAARTGERVLVSTRTIALQDQLDRKDIPLLSAVLPYEVTAVVAKGRNNYLCLRRLERALKLSADLFDDSASRIRLQEIAAWAGQGGTGTLSDLPFKPPPAVWEQVQAESGNCSQRRCPHYEACFYQQARRRMEAARVLVVNHALYFSDLALRIQGAVYLPDHTVVIFDEAHTVEKVATECLGASIGPGRLEHLLARLHSGRTAKGLLAALACEEAIEAVGEARAAGQAFFEEARRWQEKHDPTGQGRLLDDDPFVPNTLSLPLSILSETLSKAAAREGLEESDAMELAAYAARAGGLARSTSLLLDERPAELVIWLEGKERRTSLVGAPLEVGRLLARHLYPARKSCVFTSATLTAGVKVGFGYLRERLGLPACGELLLGSPFHYDRNVEIHLHADLPDPTDAEPWEEAILDRIRALVLAEGGRSLVLFTSWRLVERARRMAADLAAEGIACLFQGEGPVQRLVERKRRSQASVLFGTDSLWEGIDIPGETLTQVIIPRLPFPVPTTPFVEARSRELKQQGRHPFKDFHLPETTLRLRQGFGRLIRGADDRGKVVFLDRRLLVKPYGRLLLRALPDCALVIRRPDGETQRVEAGWQEAERG